MDNTSKTNETKPKKRQDSQVPSDLLKNPKNFEKDHVLNVYDNIASHFSHTRYKGWPLIDKFLKELPKGSFVADVGCGNGKYLNANPDCIFIGSDLSSKLIEICQERGFNALVSDGLVLPYKDNSFDASISIAVIHHFSSIERRVAFIEEMFRITRAGGNILITAWALEQKKFEHCQDQDQFISWTIQDNSKKSEVKKKQKDPEKTKQAKRLKKKDEKLKKKQKENYVQGEDQAELKRERIDDQKNLEKDNSNQPNTINNTNNNDNNANNNNTKNIDNSADNNKSANNNANNNNNTKNIDNNAKDNDSNNNNTKLSDNTTNESNEKKTFQRYYHLFKKGELEELCTKIKYQYNIVESVWDADNWYILLKKL